MVARVDEEALSQLISLGGLITGVYKFSVRDIIYAPTINVRVSLVCQEEIVIFY